MIRIKTQKVLHNLGNIFKMNIVSPRAAFKTQSKVYGGAFLQKYQHLAANSFCQKAPS